MRTVSIAVFAVLGGVLLFGGLLFSTEGWMCPSMMAGIVCILIAVALRPNADNTASKNADDEAAFRQWKLKRAEERMKKIEDPVEKWAREHPDQDAK